VLDLKAVPFLDSAGLGELVSTHVGVKRLGGALQLANVNQRVRSALDTRSAHARVPADRPAAVEADQARAHRLTPLSGTAADPVPTRHDFRLTRPCGGAQAVLMIRMFPLLVALALVACSRSSPASANTGAASPASPAAQLLPGQTLAAPTPVPATLPDVLAKVNGASIGKADFERALRDLEDRTGEPVPAGQRDRVYRGVLDQIIAYRLLAQESRTRKLVVTEAELDSRVENIRKQFPSKEAFTQTLEQRNITLDTLRADAKEGMHIDKMLEAELASRIAVSAAQVTDFYEKNTTQFQQSERVRASHILIRFPENADPAAKEQARTRAAEVLAEVKTGKDFAGLAKQHSQDTGSAENGGDLGLFERGQMVGPFDEVAFSLQATQISDLVETTFGYHIIKVAERQAERTVPLDEVRPQIEQFLEDQNRQNQTQAFVEVLKAKGKIEIFI
jgi:peptidyl-prolyl cis-trans isomerase C